MKVRVIGPRDRKPSAEEGGLVMAVSRADGPGKALSPMLLGPVNLPDGRIAQRMENAWQYSKVYEGFTGPDGLPNQKWYDWSNQGFNKTMANRYPMGKGAKPLYAWDGKNKLDYITARRELYFPLYRDSVAKTKEFKLLQTYAENLEHQKKTMYIFDFDGYAAGDKSLAEVLNDPTRIMGHGFILAAMVLHGPDITPDELDFIYKFGVSGSEFAI